MALIYHETVRRVRQTDGNALAALGKALIQNMILVVSFYLMFDVLGLRGNSIRGNFILYIMSGIFMYMTHIKAMGAVAGAGNATSGMMLHAPMNTFIAIVSAALSALYLQMMAVVVILFATHVLIEPIYIYQPVYGLGLFLLAWGTGCSVGLVLFALKPWFPTLVGIFQQLYSRANMIASGKMFLANSLPPMMLSLFDWNPLFHVIDQARGALFINYFPQKTNVQYPLYAMLALFMIGLMWEFYTRQHESASWGARR